MKKRIGKKTGFIVLFCLFAMNTVFADYTITYKVRVPYPVNKPKKIKGGEYDGYYEVADQGKTNPATGQPYTPIKLQDDPSKEGYQNPNDSNNYKDLGGIPQGTAYKEEERVIPIEGNNPPSDIEVQKQIEADIEKIAKKIEEANENSGATNNNKTTGLVTVNGTVTIQNNINKEVVR